MSKRRPKVVAGVKPWSCVTLSVDPGERCGVAIYDHGVYYDSACGDGYDTAFIAHWICEALFVARRWGVPLVLVLEKPPAGGRPFMARGAARSRHGTRFQAIAGMGSVIGCRKLWQRTWTKAQGTVGRYVVDVYPPTWRAPVLGTLVNVAPRERVRASIEKYGKAADGGVRGMPQDECAAICIGIWASNAPKVLAVLPAKLREKCAS